MTTERKLTAAEEHVARLVARGRTNAEIAKALCVEPRTVAAHLTRAYRKLGVRSRTELALLIAERSTHDAERTVIQ
jgi:DNA-binding NarL/FixJ family response regulator